MLTIAAIPVGLGGVISRYLGPETWLIGIGVAVYVTVCFAVVILGDLALQCVLGWRDRRLAGVGRRTDGTAG